MAGGGLAPARGGEPPPSSIKAFYKKYKRVTRYNVGDGFLVLAIGNLNNGTGNGGVSYANLNNGLTNANWNILGGPLALSEEVLTVPCRNRAAAKIDSKTTG